MAKKKVEKEEKDELALALADLEKEYGKGAVISGSDVPNYSEVISTGSIGLDYALGIGGLPVGKIIEFLGWESSGKSTITLHIIAEAQKKGHICLLIDAENSFDENYAESLGVDVDALIIIQMDGEGAEVAYAKAARLIQSGKIRVCVADSVSALQPKKILLEGAEGVNMGLHSRLMGKVCPQFNMLADEYNCMCIFISQIREKIGVMFGPSETTQGGNALKFYAHMRLDIRKSILKEGDEAYANKTKVKVIKNKLARPFKTAEFNINYGEGIDKVDEIITLGAQTGILKKWGKQITLLEGEETKWELDEFKKELTEPEKGGNISLYESLKNKITEKLKRGVESIKEEEKDDNT